MSALLLVLATSAGPGAEYTIDPDHAFALFSASHLGIGVTHGRFDRVSGSFVLDESSPASSSVVIQIDPASVNSGVKKRDGHLLGPDFLHAKQFPKFTFKSQSVRRLGPGRFEVAGTLELRGKSKPLTVRVESTGQGKDPWGGYRAGFKTSFELKRSEFGMTYGVADGLVGDTVRIEFAAEGIRR
ncbi:MAG: YceI family protein [Myxococcota bacterium]